MIPETIISAIVLLVVTTIVLYGILYNMKPSYVLNSDKEKTVSKLKTFFYAITSSLIFTIIITIISINVDKHYAKKQKSLDK